MQNHPHECEQSLDDCNRTFRDIFRLRITIGDGVKPHEWSLEGVRSYIPQQLVNPVRHTLSRSTDLFHRPRGITFDDELP